MGALIITGIVCFVAGMLFIPLLKSAKLFIEFVATVIESLFM